MTQIGETSRQVVRLKRAFAQRHQWPWLVFALLGLLAFVGPHLAPYDPNEIPPGPFVPSALPSASHWLGTDALGRDVGSRLLAGSRYTLGVAGVALTIAAFLGVLVGALSALVGGWVDRILMRTVDTLLSIPRLLLLLAVIGMWGRPSIWLLAAVLGTTGWFGLSRLVRIAILAELAEAHVLASRALGATRWWLVRHHLLPSLRTLVAVWMSAAFGGLILLESGLSFVGLGVTAPFPSWGTVLVDAGDVFGTARWLVLGPGILIALVVILVQRSADTIERGGFA
jgi:peptide/nickel transport system permease protein